MALSRHDFDRLAQRLKSRRREFGQVFRELVGRQCYAIDERLRADVDRMGPFETLRPLPDGDRVILRTRMLWLFADHRAIRGTLTVPSTWILPATLRALEGATGRGDRCPRPETEMKLLNSLVEYYAEQVVLERLAPAVQRWIDGTTTDMLDALQLPEREFAAVRNLVKRLAHEEQVAQLTRLGQLDANPAEIRRDPFRSFR